MTTTTVTPTKTATTTTKTKQPSVAARIRTLLATGHTPVEIAATLGIPVQRVYAVRSVDKNKQQSQRISARTGKPVRKYTKAKPSLAERGAELMRMTQEKKAALVPAPTPAPNGQVMLLEAELDFLRRELDMERARLPRTIEVPVPQPWSHYTFWQRLRIVFFGKA